MHEILDIVKIVLIVIVSLVAFLLILKFSVDIIKNIQKIKNIKKLRKRSDTMAVTATVFKAEISEKDKKGKFRHIFFEYTAEEKTYCKEMFVIYSDLNEVSKGDKIYIYYEKQKPENCVLKENWEEKTYKYFIQWDVAYIFCILIFVAVNCLIKLF